MRIIKKQSEKILSKYESYPTRITNIKNTDRSKIKETSNNPAGGNRSQAESSNNPISGDRAQTSSFQSVTLSDKIFNYEFYFNCDMRRILSYDISQIEYSIVSSIPKKREKFFSNIDKASNVNVIASAGGQRKDNRRKLANDRRTKTIKTGTISLSREVSNLDTSNFTSLTDEQLFGSAIKTKIVSKKKLLKRGNFSNELSQIVFQTVDGSRQRLGSPKSLYHNLINKNIDPAAAFKSINNTTSPDPRNVIDPKRSFIKTGIYSTDVDLNSLRGSYEQANGENSFNISKKNIGSFVAVPVKVPNRVRTLVKKIQIRESQLKGLKKFIILLTIKNPKTGLKQETFQIKVDHSLNVENYYIPDRIPAINTVVKSNGTKIMKLGCEEISGDDFLGIKGINLFYRNIVDDSSLLLNPYIKGDKILAQDLLYTKCGNSGKVMTVQDYSKLQTRSCPVLITDTLMGNFSHSSEKGKMFNHAHCTIFACTKRDGIIDVNVSNLTDNIIGISVYRKQIGSPEGFKVVGSDRQNVDINDIDFDTSKAITSNISHNTHRARECNVIDADIKSGKVYVYKARMYLDDGTVQMSRDSSIVKYQTVFSFGTVTIENLSTSGDSSESNDANRYTSFDIGHEFTSSSTDDIIEVISQAGYGYLFEDEESNIKHTISDMSLFGIERINLTTGNEEFLGYFPSGSFADGTIESTMPSIFMDYEYRVGLYLFSPEQVQSYLTTATSNNLNIATRTSQLGSPSTYTKMKETIRETSANRATTQTSKEKIASYTESKLQKYINPVAMGTGVISDFSDMMQSYPVEGYYTGTFKSVFSNKNAESNVSIVTIPKKGLTLSRSGYPVLRFTFSQSRNSLSNIDMVVIKCKKQGSMSICGACHISSSGITFVDYSNKEYVGHISYFANIILLDGTSLSDIPIVSGILHNREPVEKKIKRA
tara:strand:- start:7065 stop:9872 length:2808 start_codon:yes stop_codon:yes gene_type:complete